MKAGTGAKMMAWSACWRTWPTEVAWMEICGTCSARARRGGPPLPPQPSPGAWAFATMTPRSTPHDCPHWTTTARREPRAYSSQGPLRSTSLAHPRKRIQVMRPVAANQRKRCGLGTDRIRGTRRPWAVRRSCARSCGCTKNIICRSQTSFSTEFQDARV